MVDKIKPNPPKKSILTKLRNYLLTGLVIVGPLILTIIIIMWLVNLVDSMVAMFLGLFPQGYIPKAFTIPGVGVVIVVILLFIIGVIGTNFLGKYFISLGEKCLNKVPIIKFIYGTIKQIFDTIFSSHAKAFKSAVLVEFPTKDSWSIGFVTSNVKEGIVKQDFNQKYAKEDEIISVFIPTTPNPTSGFLLYVLKKNTLELNVPANVAMKIIISGGMLSPSDISKEKLQK